MLDRTQWFEITAWLSRWCAWSFGSAFLGTAVLTGQVCRSRRPGSSSSLVVGGLAGCGALSLLAGGVWLVEFSPVLVAHSVRVEGVQAGDVSNIVGRAAVPMGTPLAKVDTLAIARRVIATATLAEVTVSRSWPSTIVISASQRGAGSCREEPSRSSAGCGFSGCCLCDGERATQGRAADQHG